MLPPVYSSKPRGATVRKQLLLLGAASALTFASAGAMAADVPMVTDELPQTEAASPLNSALYLELGAVDILANEIVWDGDWRLSQLIWKSTAPALVGGFNLDFNRFTISGEIGVAFGGDSSMVDYDWIMPFAVANGPDDWSDRSLHPDTQLAHYFRGELTFGYNVVETGTVTVNAHVGGSYTDVLWNAYGGSYIYSDAAFRDTVGDFPDGQLGISYRQQLPILFAGIDVEADLGAWRLGATADVGLTIRAVGTDDHWLRDLQFIDAFSMGPTLHLAGRAERDFSHGLTGFLEVDYDKVFEVLTDTTMIDTTIPAVVGTFPDGGGADFQAFTFTLGVTLHF